MSNTTKPVYDNISCDRVNPDPVGVSPVDPNGCGDADCSPTCRNYPRKKPVYEQARTVDPVILSNVQVHIRQYETLYKALARGTDGELVDEVEWEAARRIYARLQWAAPNSSDENLYYVVGAMIERYDERREEAVNEKARAHFAEQEASPEPDYKAYVAQSDADRDAAEYCDERRQMGSGW